MIPRDSSLKQHKTGCYLDSDLIGKPMARRALKKINTKLNLLLRQSNYLNCLEDYSIMHILTMIHVTVNLLRVRP